MGSTARRPLHDATSRAQGPVHPLLPPLGRHGRPRALGAAERRAARFNTPPSDASPVNLVTDKKTEGQVYVWRYLTMMGLIDEMSGAGAASAWAASTSSPGHWRVGGGG